MQFPLWVATWPNGWGQIMRSVALLVSVGLLMANGGCSTGPAKAPPNALEYSYVTNAELPGGQRGELFVFMGKRLARPIRIAHAVDGKLVEDLAVLEGVPLADWVVITMPEDTHMLNVFGSTDAKTIPLVPEGATFSGEGGMSSGYIRPGEMPNSSSLFFERDVTYTPVEGGPDVTVTHAFHLLYGKKPGLRGATPDHRSRLSKTGVESGLHPGAEYQCLAMKWYADGRDELVVGMLWRAREFGLVPLNYTYKYKWDTEREGRLSIDGAWVDQADRPQLWVNGPYGKMVRVDLTEDDKDRLRAFHQGQTRATYGEEALESLWMVIVEPKLYRFEGQFVDGKKHGPWTVHLADGTRYMQGSYDMGKRTGHWTVWYPDGTVCAEADYVGGELDGEWVVYDRDGKVRTRIRWSRGLPVDGPVTWQGPGEMKTLGPDGLQQMTSGSP